MRGPGESVARLFISLRRAPTTPQAEQGRAIKEMKGYRARFPFFPPLFFFNFFPSPLYYASWLHLLRFDTGLRGSDTRYVKT